MKALIVATSTTPATYRGASTHHHRIDYIELAARLQADYVDYSIASSSKMAKRLEDLAKLDVIQAYRVAALVRRVGYDVVFSLSERVGIPLALFLDSRVKHVVLAHHILSRHKLRLITTCGLLNRLDELLVPTMAEADRLRRDCPEMADQVSILNNVCDETFYQRPPVQQGSDELDHILSLGLAHRDYPTLIEALGRIPAIPCRISAGSLWLTQRANYGTRPFPANVHLYDYAPVHQLPARYAACRFVVVPLNRDTTHWTAGTQTILQAQAMGKAVIVTRNPGSAEYVADGETGLLVDGGDPTALSDAIQRLWNEPERAAAMGRQARRRIESRFSFDGWLDSAAALVRRHIASVGE